MILDSLFLSAWGWPISNYSCLCFHPSVWLLDFNVDVEFMATGGLLY